MASDAHKNQFSQLVEQLAISEEISLLEALAHIVEDNQMDYNGIKQMLSLRLLEKLKQESVQNHLVDGEKNPATIASFLVSNNPVKLDQDIIDQYRLTQEQVQSAKIQF